MKCDGKNTIQRWSRVIAGFIFVKLQGKSLVLEIKNERGEELEHFHGKRSLTGIFCNQIT